MSATTVSPGVRRVLEAPRGQRFTRPGARVMSREQRLLAQMRGNPRVEYRLAHGELPPWMEIARRRQDEARSHEPALVPAVPRHPAGHRRPRGTGGWMTAGYLLAALTGGWIHHVVSGLP